MIFVPMVLMMRTPPAMVPSPIATAQPRMTQVGTANRPDSPPTGP